MSSHAPGRAPSPRNLVSIVVARFDDLLARGIRELLDSDASLAIVAQDVEQRRIPVVLRAHRPDVAILDAHALDKLAEVRELAVAHPATRLVLFVDELSSAECAQLLAFGASACLARDTQARDVLNAVHLASRGLKLVPRFASSPGASAGGGLLTRREAEVLPLLAQGRSNPQIALELDVGVETVRTHARNIYRKLGVSSRIELTGAPLGDRDRPLAAPELGRARRRAVGRRPHARRGHDTRHT